MDKEQIISDIDQTFNTILLLISGMDDEFINLIPFETSWTAGQVAQHIIISGSGFADILYGAVEKTKREYDAIKLAIKSDFLNFDIKMTSPDFIVPPAIRYNKADLVSNLTHIKTALTNAVNSLNLRMTCLSFDVGYGYFTRYEAIYFVIYHTQRHIHQLKNIIKQLNKSLIQ
jgi:hypothetical protein